MGSITAGSSDDFLIIEPISPESLSETGDPFQTVWWASIKQPLGWIPEVFSLHDQRDGHLMGKIMILLRDVAGGLCTIAYVHGDLLLDVPQEERFLCLERLCVLLSSYLPRTTYFIRFDLAWERFGSKEGDSPVSWRFVSLPYAIQPESTVKIDLTIDEEQLLAACRTRVRRNLKKTQERLIITSWGRDMSIVHEWYELYLETAARDGFTPRPKEQLVHMLGAVEERGKRSLGPEPDLLVAFDRGSKRVVGGVITVRTPDRCLYLYGASQRMSEYSATYQLIWHAILEAKSAGCTMFDLYGIAGSGKGSDHLQSLDLFKTGFGGRVVTYIGTHDYILKPIRYGIFRVLEYVRIKKARNTKRILRS